MTIDESGSTTTDRVCAPAQRVSLSKWVNERFPSYQELLSSHDVARLTRRNRWVLAALTAVGRFPAKQRFHGRTIGWRRQDVERWLAERLATQHGCESRSAILGTRYPVHRDRGQCAVAAANARCCGCRASIKPVQTAPRDEAVKQ